MYFYGKKKKIQVVVVVVVVHLQCGSAQRAECPRAVVVSSKVGTVSQGSDQASRIMSPYLGDGSFLCGWSSQIMPQQNVPVSPSFLLSANLE